MLVFPFFGRSKESGKGDTGKQEKVKKECSCESLSVIVPAFNEEANIGGALKSARSHQDAECVAELIVVDGGSTDKTCEIARSMGAQVIKAPKGRATQMNAGARVAKGDVLLFLHSDCILPPGYENLILDAMCPPDTGSQAPPPEAASPLSKPGMARVRPACPPGWGAFAKLALDGPGPGLRLVEKGVEMRTRWKRLPYGDQGIFVHRRLFEEVGGYRDMPLMEDYQLVRDLNEHSQPTLIDAAITASARRWEKKGVLQTTLTNQFIIVAYKLGVPPSRLARWYRDDERHFWQLWNEDKTSK